MTKETIYLAINLAMAESCQVEDKNVCNRCIYQENCNLIRTNSKIKDYIIEILDREGEE